MPPTNSAYFVKMTSTNNLKRDVLSVISMSRSVSLKNITIIVYLIVKFFRKKRRKRKDCRKKSSKDIRERP